MPWKESHHTMERAQFIQRILSGERITDLCKEFGISRKTGYKFLRRYQDYGEVGLLNESTRPLTLARLTPEPIEKMIIDLRRQRPTWGASKLGEILRKHHPHIHVPHRSTIHDILVKHSLVKTRKRKLSYAQPTDLTCPNDPNGLWCVDYKGHFRLGNKKYCYPLTITDFATRFILCCEGLEDTSIEKAKPVFAQTFKSYGLPLAIRSDNGAPFASRGLFGLSKLSVWWIKLGIVVEHIEPGKPQQNGRHERMHLTLKQETTRPSANNLLQQQERFDRFVRDFNTLRPHEALEMKPPSTRYCKASRTWDGVTPEPDYSSHDLTAYVSAAGKVYVRGVGNFNLSVIFAGETIGLSQEDEDLWLVSFSALDLGYFDAREGIFHAKNGEVR